VAIQAVIAAAPSISMASLGDGEQGAPDSQTISASGGTAPYTFNVSSTSGATVQ